MKTSDVLIQAKALIATPETWIKNDYTRTLADGTQCFCSLGAIQHVMNPDDVAFMDCDWSRGNNEPHKLLCDVNVADGFQHLTFADFNDHHTHSEVMEAFDKAIERALIKERLTS